MPRFSCMVDAEPLPVHDSMVGIHVGLESFAVTSDGGNHETTRVVIGGHKGNRAESNVMCLAVSNVFRAGARPVGSPPSCTAMCSHQRNDFQHKLSRELVNHYGRIAVEDFNVQGLAGGMLAKSVHDAAWSSFLAKLLDKAESADRVLGESRPERNLATMPWWKASSEETLESAPSVFAWSKHNPRPRLGIGNSTARTAPKNRNACHNGRGS